MDPAGRPPSILVIEDDRKTSAAVKLYLENAGFAVALAFDGRQGLEAARSLRPDLVVLDVMLPQVDGLEVCRTLQAESEVPVILLTARTTEADKLRGLDLGADDYVTKPFSPRELVARVRAVLRRAGPREAGATEDGPAELRFRDLIVDLARREVAVRGERVTLTRHELQLLAALARAPGRAFSRTELVERAFGWDYEGMERTVDVHVKNLRRKLGATWIETVFGVGYRFAGEPLAVP
ncbi:MAG TPA: response regulator transcription factor [Thermoanaerobaculia bacterium]|jgi:DNA-binding response OmpR family regulator|nr:response regulator transcription factor [Thermoanaerobaculia bacterium]